MIAGVSECFRRQRLSVHRGFDGQALPDFSRSGSKRKRQSKRVDPAIFSITAPNSRPSTARLSSPSDTSHLRDE